MTTADDDIEYSGPNLGFEPSIGDSRENVDSPIRPAVPDLYDPTDDLVAKLDAIIVQTTNLISDLERDLYEHFLPVTEEDIDERLRTAHAAEWPSDLGNPRNLIGYRYYKVLRLRDTNAASYIRKRYENSVREVNGSNGIDMLPLVEATRAEAFNIKGFLDKFIKGRVSGSAEETALQLLHEWADAALEHSRIMRRLFETSETQRQLPIEEVTAVTSETARTSQAIFKHKLNELNDVLVENHQTFKKQFVDFSSVFYQNFLGPALEIRRASLGLNVPQTNPKDLSSLNRELVYATIEQDRRLQDILADLVRRNKIYDRKHIEIRGQIEMRDTYRSYIKQLAPKGAKVKVGAPGISVPGEDSSDQIEFFETFSRSASSNYGAPHSELAGLDSDNAHPQYLLKDGDTITGNVAVDDFVTIDGVDLDLHGHTGLDGSTQIRGSDIVGGTLITGAVDGSDVPDDPDELQVVSFNARVVPPGVTVVDTILSWDGDSALQYDVQVVVKE